MPTKETASHCYRNWKKKVGLDRHTLRKHETDIGRQALFWNVKAKEVLVDGKLLDVQP